MTTAEIITNMLDQMTDLETAGCEVVVADPGVRELWEIYKSHGLHGHPAQASCLLAGTQDKKVWVRIPDPAGKGVIYDGDFPVNLIGKVADKVNRQAGFILSHPEMFAGCEVDL